MKIECSRTVLGRINILLLQLLLNKLKMERKTFVRTFFFSKFIFSVPGKYKNMKKFVFQGKVTRSGERSENCNKLGIMWSFID